MRQKVPKDLLKEFTKEDFDLGNVPNLNTTNAVNWVINNGANVLNTLPLKKDKGMTSATVTSNGLFPNVDLVLFGAGGAARTGTIDTSVMYIGQVITIKRNIGATGTLTIKGLTGNINTLTNTMAASTTLATAGSYGQTVSFRWDGTNLIRIN